MSLGSRRRKDLKHHIPPLQKKWESSKVFYRRVKLPESEFNLLEEALLTKTVQLAPHQAPEYHPTELLPRASQLVGINPVEVWCKNKHSYNAKHCAKKKSKIDKKTRKSGPLELQILLCYISQSIFRLRKTQTIKRFSRRKALLVKWGASAMLRGGVDAMIDKLTVFGWMRTAKPQE